MFIQVEKVSLYGMKDMKGRYKSLQIYSFIPPKSTIMLPKYSMKHKLDDDTNYIQVRDIYPQGKVRKRGHGLMIV